MESGGRRVVRLSCGGGGYDQVNTRLMNFSSVSSLTFPQYTAATTGSDLSEEHVLQLLIP